MLLGLNRCSPFFTMPSCVALSLTAPANALPHASSMATTTYDFMPADFISSTSMSPCRTALMASRNMLSSKASCGASDEGVIKSTLSPSSNAIVLALLRMFTRPWLVVGPT